MSFLTEDGIAFFKRRDERNEIILECLTMPDWSRFEKDEYGDKYIFQDNEKEYTYYLSSDGSFQSYEFWPKMGQMREILGVPMVGDGIGYSHFSFWSRVVWSHWGGALTDDQIKRVVNVIAAADSELY